MYMDSIYRVASSILAAKPTWIAQRRHEGQVEYFSIVDPIETQQLLHDVIRVFIHGYAKDVGYELNAEATPWYPRHMAQQESSKKIDKQNTTTTTSKQQNIEKLIDNHNFGWKVVRKGTKTTQETTTKQRRVHHNRFNALETEDDMEIYDGSDEEEDEEDKEGSEEESQSCNSNAAKFDVEQMSVEEMEEILTKTKEECKQCEEMTEAYEGLVCEYKRVEQYAMEQESQTEELENTNHCILLMYYLQENERKAQMKQNKKLIERCNEKELEYNEIARYYKELQEKYVRATNEREQMEFRRNQSRYKK